MIKTNPAPYDSLNINGKTQTQCTDCLYKKWKYTKCDKCTKDFSFTMNGIELGMTEKLGDCNHIPFEEWLKNNHD